MSEEGRVEYRVSVLSFPIARRMSLSRLRIVIEVSREQSFLVSEAEGCEHVPLPVFVSLQSLVS